MKYYLAPLEGVTGYIYRNALEKYFPGADRYFTPFIAPNQKRALRTRELNDILPAHNRVPELIPQILTNDPQLFLETAGELLSYGYQEVNLNLGCPSGTVVPRGRGAGFLAHPDKLAAFLDEIFEKSPVKISIKTRLGMSDPQEIFPLIELYNRFPLTELILHPRTRSEFYLGTPHLDLFREVLPLCRMPLCYNGNIFDTKSPAIAMCDRLMAGRGVIANPGLIRQLKGLPDTGGKATWKAFHDEIFEGYCEANSGELPAISHMKELWFYMLPAWKGEPHEIEKLGKQIRKAKKRSEYLSAIHALFDALIL